MINFDNLMNCSLHAHLLISLEDEKITMLSRFIAKALKDAPDENPESVILSVLIVSLREWDKECGEEK